MLRNPSLLLLGAYLITLCKAHGNHGSRNSHDQVPVTEEEEQDWATRHMKEEHHISSFDAPSFFTLHDYDSNGYWDGAEIQRTYGLEDESNRNVDEHARYHVKEAVLREFDEDGDERIDMGEWIKGWKGGKRLMDFGLGRGAHYNYEIEYELNHFEHFHDENTDEGDLTHPEDIEHFKRHELEDEEEARQAEMDRMPIVEANIPAKFRRQR